MKKAKALAPSGVNTSVDAVDSTAGPSSAKPGTPAATPGVKSAGKGKLAATPSQAAVLNGNSLSVNGGAPSIATMSHAELIDHYAEVSAKYEQVGLLQEKLSTSLKRKGESYVRREVQYKSEISHLKETLEQTVLCRGGEEVSMPAIRQLHGKIMSQVDEMQIRSKRIVEEHERELLRQFRGKLLEIEDRLKRDMSKMDDVSGVPRVWIERISKLGKDVDKHKEQAIRLDRINEVLTKNIEKYRLQCRTQEEDREGLVRQLVAIKKENARLQREIEKMSDGMHLEGMSRPVTSKSASGRVSQLRETVSSASRPKSSSSALADTGGGAKGKGKGSVGAGGKLDDALADALVEADRYHQVVERLRKLLEGERRSVRDTRAQHMRLTSSQTELEVMLREAVDHVKSELGLGGDPHNISEIKIFTKKEREGVLEVLLSQEKTIRLLYETDQGRGSNATGRGSASGMDSTSRHVDDDRNTSSYADGLADVDGDEEDEYD